MSHFKRILPSSSESSLQTRIVQNSGFKNYFGAIQDFTGINLQANSAFGFISTNSSANTGDYSPLYLVPDTTYVFKASENANSNQPILTFEVIDDATGTVYYTATEDCYAASTTLNPYSWSFTFTPPASVSRATPRKCLLRLSNATKNASSSGYYIVLAIRAFYFYWTSTSNTLINPALDKQTFMFNIDAMTFSSGTSALLYDGTRYITYWSTNSGQIWYIDFPLIVGKQYAFNGALELWSDRGKLKIDIVDPTNHANVYNALGTFDSYGPAVANTFTIINETFTYSPSAAIDTVHTARVLFDNSAAYTGSARYIVPARMFTIKTI